MRRTSPKDITIVTITMTMKEYEHFNELLRNATLECIDNGDADIGLQIVDAKEIINNNRVW